MKAAASEKSSSINPEAPNWIHWLLPFALAAITAIVFWPATSCDFVNYDDPRYVSENVHVHGWSWQNIKWAFTAMHGGNWHPLTWLSHMLDWEFSGPNPRGHHLTNVLLHSINAMLLFQLMRNVTGTIGRSAFLAALFALHPLHVESVAWVAERKDVLSTFFGLLSLLSYAKYAKAPQQARVVWSFSLLFFALSLMSKPMLVTLPFVFLLLDFWPLRRMQSRAGGIRKLILEKSPFFLLALLSCPITIAAQRHDGALHTLEDTSLFMRFSNAAVSAAAYLEKAFWPVNLAVFYPQKTSIPLPQLFFAGAVLFIIFFLAIRWRTRRPYLLMGWLWFIGTLIPVIGIVQVGIQAMADRYTYVPLIGIFVCVVWGVFEFASKLRVDHRVLGASGLAALTLCAFVTHRQLGFWKNDRTLFQRVYDATPENYLAAFHLAADFLKNDRIIEAQQMFERGLEWYARFADTGASAENKTIAKLQKAMGDPRRYTDAAVQLGVLYLEKNNLPEAESLFRAALQREPENANALHHLGIVQRRQNKLEEAVFASRRAIELAPSRGDSYLNLARCFLAQNKNTDARTTFLEGLRQDSNNIQLREGYAMFLDGQGNAREAASEYRKILELDPEAVETLNNFAWLLATAPDLQMRNGNEAVRLAKKACDLSKSRLPVIIGTLGAAYAEVGNFAEAVQTAEWARSSAIQQNQPAVAQANEKLIELYRAGKTARDLK